MTSEPNVFVSQLVNRPFLYSNGCELQYLDTLNVTVLPGVVRDDTNTMDMVLNEPLTLSFNNLTMGTPNGVDRNIGDLSVIPFGGWFAVYLIGNNLNSLPTACVAVPQFLPFNSFSNSPAVPYTVNYANGVGYTKKRLIGWVNFVIINAIKQIRPFTFNTKGMNYRAINWTLPVDVGPPNDGAAPSTFLFDTFNGNINFVVAPHASYIALKLQINPQAANALSIGITNSDVDPVSIDPSFGAPFNYPLSTSNGTGPQASENSSDVPAFFQASSGRYGFGTYKTAAVTGNPPNLNVNGFTFQI